MKKQSTLWKCAIADVEWEYPIEYAAAFEKAIEALKKQTPMKVTEERDSTRLRKLYCPNC